MIVWISGPTGAGKSSLARLLSSSGYSVVQESLPAERFRAFASDPVRHCESLQEDIMRSRLNGWRGVSTSSRVLFDRSIDEDVRIFCRMHRDLNLLDDQQFARLQGLAQQLQRDMPEPDLILFMCSETRVLAQRVTPSSHPRFIVENLEQQVSLYTDWLTTRREDILKVDNSACSLRAIERLFGEERLC